MRCPPALLLVLSTNLLTAQNPASLPAPPAPIAAAEFAARRATLVQEILKDQPDAHFAVVVRGSAGQTDMGAFVQTQDFLYLTGIAEPGLALLLVPGPDGALATDQLLVPPFSPLAATWDGNFLAPGEESAKRTGFATVGNVRSLAETLATTLVAANAGTRPVLYTLTRPAPRIGGTPSKAASAAAAQAGDAFDGRTSREEAFVEYLKATYSALSVKGLEPFLNQLRPVKSPAELSLLRASAVAAAEGIAEAMRGTHPGLYEFHLAAVARYVFSVRGGGPDAYAAIVGAGPNGCILHYSKNDRQLQDADLIVMDYAPTVRGYASDVTRTFPASGTFSPAQRKLVQDVYDIQQALIAEVKPGAKLSALGRKCQEMLQERGYRSDHGPCHHVGLAVHDPSVDELRAGMVITVEPGAYLRDQGMGCRIEDTILVTNTGAEVLSVGVPSSPDAIEKLMREKGLLDIGMRVGADTAKDAGKDAGK